MSVPGLYNKNGGYNVNLLGGTDPLTGLNQPGVSVLGLDDVLSVTPVLDTAIYADGDVLFVPIQIPSFFSVADKARPVHSLIVIDEDDQGVGFDLLFFSTAVTLGTINAAPSISDTDIRSYLGRISIGASDYIDLGGCKVADIHSIGLEIKPTTGQTYVYVAGITRSGTPTYTASGLKLRIGVL